MNGTTIKNGLYHAALGLPVPALAPFCGEFSLEYTDHARRAFRDDRYYRPGLEPLTEIFVEAADIVEAEVINGVCVKAVARLMLSDDLDAVLVLVEPKAGKVRAKTFWMNRADDTHATLDRSKYNRLALS